MVVEGSKSTISLFTVKRLERLAIQMMSAALALLPGYGDVNLMFDTPIIQETTAHNGIIFNYLIHLPGPERVQASCQFECIDEFCDSGTVSFCFDSSSKEHSFFCRQKDGGVITVDAELAIA